MKRLLLLSTLLIHCVFIQAQEFFLNADLISNYIWRGMKSGNASIQPAAGVTWKGLTFSIDGNTEFRDEYNELNINLKYETGNWAFCLIDYFEQGEEEPFAYFRYGSHNTGHTFEAGTAYRISDRFPLSLSWYTTFAGNDYRENGTRAWSSYGEISYPFSLKEMEFSLELGFTPWEGMYSDKFNVVNVGLTVSKEIKLSSHFPLPVFGKLIANPYEEQAYFVFGISL